MFDLSRYLPYLLNRAGVRIALAFTDEIRRFGITLPVWRVLAQLWHVEFERQSDIALRTSIEPATLSRLLKGIEAQGLIVRRRSSANAREVGVALTDKGRELTRRIIPLALRYESLAVGALAPDRVEALKDALVEVYENIASYHDTLLGRARRAAAPHRAKAVAAAATGTAKKRPGRRSARQGRKQRDA